MSKVARPHKRNRSAAGTGVPTKSGAAKKSGKAASRSRSKFSAKPAARAGSGYRIVGKTSDGVEILRAKVGPTHFTAKEVRDVLNELLGNATKA